MDTSTMVTRAITVTACSLWLAILMVSSVDAFSSSELLRTIKAGDHSTLFNSLQASEGFKLQLIHRDHLHSPLRKAAAAAGLDEHAMNPIARSFARAKAMHSIASKSGNGGTIVPISPAKGEYLMNISLGTPVRTYVTIMDTGSDLIWIQCKPCLTLPKPEGGCFKQPDPIFNILESKTYQRLKCTDKPCLELEAINPRSTHCDHEDKNVCLYQYRYGDLSITQGDLATETFNLNTSSTVTGGVPSSVEGVAFGCGNENGLTNNPGVDGIVGMGRASISLVNQLAPVVGEGFSYCLQDLATSKRYPSPMVIGSAALRPDDSDMKYTPLLNATYTHYYLSMKGISVAGERLDINASIFDIDSKGDGGVVADSGTTIVLMFDEAMNKTRDALARRISLPRVARNVSISYDTVTQLLCYNISAVEFPSVAIPTITLHFEGTDWELPWDNTFVAFKELGSIKLGSELEEQGAQLDDKENLGRNHHDDDEGVVCLSWIGAGDEYPLGIIGNIAQRDHLIVHDTKNKRFGFKRTNCGLH